jgi:hypothetical protein
MTKRTHIQYVKKSNLCTALFRTRGFQEVEATIFQDNRHMKVARLSARRTVRFTPHEIFLKFCWRLRRSQSH